MNGRREKEASPALRDAGGLNFSPSRSFFAASASAILSSVARAERGPPMHRYESSRAWRVGIPSSREERKIRSWRGFLAERGIYMVHVWWVRVICASWMR